MALGLKVAVTGSLLEAFEQELTETKRAITAAVVDTGTELRDELRAQVRTAGLGSKLEKAWRLERYPKRGASLSPAALVFSKSTRIHAAFDRGGVIKVRNANWLVIPLPPALRQKFHLSQAHSKSTSQPRKYSEVDAAIRRYGKLRFVQVDPTTALLIADNATKTGRVSSAKGGRKRRKGGGPKGVAIFLLKKEAHLRKSLDIQRVFNRADSLLARNLAQRLGANAA